MNKPSTITILGIESSCDETSASIACDGKILANVIAGQDIHKKYGGVVPELASRAHQINIVPVVNEAISRSGIKLSDISAVAYTRGPGLMGSLLVGSSFAKSFALALDIPLIEVNHMQAHVLCHFIPEAHIDGKGILQGQPKFPFICLTVSGGHTQLIIVKSHFDMEVIGETIDDAAGEAFDKVAKIIGLEYPGGPEVDKLSKIGDPKKFNFSKPQVHDLNFSFSGLKTSFLYLVNEHKNKNSKFIEENKADLCASIQSKIIEILMEKLLKASKLHKISTVAIAGGVSANSGLRMALINAATEYNLDVYIPKLEYCTDNAAMIAITGYYKYLDKNFSTQDAVAKARYSL